MSIQKVNTDSIASAAAAISSANTNINSAFETIRNAGKSMDSSWNSRAGDAAQTLMYQLFNENEKRSSVLQNYVTLLQQVVNPGYIQSETENTKLSDMFL